MHKAATRLRILDVFVTPSTMSRTGDIVAEAVRSKEKVRGVFCTTHMIMGCHDMPAVRDAVNASDIVATDGMPLVWLSRLKGVKDVERVYGPDALLAFCERGVTAGWRHYFYGSTASTLDRLVARLSERFPGLVVVGSYSPPYRALTEQEKEDITRQINNADPDIVWVGLGMPKQELWIAEFQPRLNAPVILAVGAAFDFHSGTVKQAPRWLQKLGLEWFFRLLQEPGRLWRRYLVYNTRFLWLLLLEQVTARTNKTRFRQKNHEKDDYSS
jgi:N-acetylglucosaminyldiphosphoundecaprenol N-acetyl-beta-D-mannosaminyltransferase